MAYELALKILKILNNIHKSDKYLETGQQKEDKEKESSEQTYQVIVGKKIKNYIFPPL